MIKLAIFDLDGTLINSIYDLADAVNASLAELGYPTHDIDKYYHFVGDGVLKLAQRALPQGHKTENDIEELHSMFSQKYQQCCLNKTKPYDNVPDTLKALKSMGVKCAVASNKPHEFTKYIVSNVFPESTFDCVFGKRDNVPTKPDPQIIFDIVNKLDLNIEDAVFIGDSDVDVITAHNAGIKCIGCAWGFRGETELINAGADKLAYKPFDILKIIEEL